MKPQFHMIDGSLARNALNINLSQMGCTLLDLLIESLLILHSYVD